MKWNPGTGFVYAGGIAILSITAASAMFPNYSSRYDAISDLGGAGTTTEVFWNTCVIIVGILWIWSSYLFFRIERRRFTSKFFYLSGIGFLLVGLSPWNVYPFTHYIGAQLIFIFGVLSCLAGSRIVTGPMSRLSIVAGVASFGSYLSGYVGMYIFLGPGGLERMVYYPIILWSIAFGGYLSYKYQNGNFQNGNPQPENETHLEEGSLSG